MFEKCLKHRITHFINKYNLFSNDQFGLNSSWKINMDVLLIFNKCIQEKFYSKKYKVMGIFLYVQKAFDSIKYDNLKKIY